jgi:ADP-ribosylglycohydrolase
MIRIFSIDEGLEMINSHKYAPDAMCNFRFLTKMQINHALEQLCVGLSPELDRAVGCLLGLAVGDALGAPLEFLPLRYADEPMARSSPPAGLNPDLWMEKELTEDELMNCRGYQPNRFGLKMAQWTDDTSMALCLADSLLAHEDFKPCDLRLRFLAWWMLGYNNTFRLDDERAGAWTHCASIGLGQTIGYSLEEFARNPTDFTEVGCASSSSGNGSIMRNAPVPIMYRRNINRAMEVAWLQSKTTHVSDESADCARLLTWICVKAIVLGEGRAVLDDLSDFPARLYSTRCLAASKPEEPCKENQGADLAGRDWRWRLDEFRYAPSRAAADASYVGSYVMDCLAMALHCVYRTRSFEAAVLRAADLCGDADTVAAVTGQLAGAIYGMNAIPTDWQSAVERWDESDIKCRAVLLFEAGLTFPAKECTEAEAGTAGKRGTRRRKR